MKLACLISFICGSVLTLSYIFIGDNPILETLLIFYVSELILIVMLLFILLFISILNKTFYSPK
jgi:hypothetical protein